MNFSVNRPYLIIPRLVEQPTWGGSYIGQFKALRDKNTLQKKIGQSYELYGKSVLSFANDTNDPEFQQDIVSCNEAPSFGPVNQNSFAIQNLIKTDFEGVLGPSSSSCDHIPLLIKFTQALGNSFQLHIKNGAKSDRWKAKPESWYYFEDGLITFGIKNKADMEEYKKVCRLIDDEIKKYSRLIKQKQIRYEDAISHLQAFIKRADPWRFVNRHQVKKHTVVDLSPGGIHHSWEEDPVHFPLGNILYEIQLDVDDKNSTIRSFDKGKLQKDGSFRQIHIDDYFTYLDTDPQHNDFDLALRKRSGIHLLENPYYSLDAVAIEKEQVEETSRSFVHLFVTEGELHVEAAQHTVSVGKGHSCFIPFAVGAYSLIPSSPKATVLKTYIR